MKYQFQYHGEAKEGHYFTIIADNESGVNLQGVDIRHLHFVLTAPRTIKAISYMEIPTFKEEPTELATRDIMDLATRALHGLVPYSMPIYKRRVTLEGLLEKANNGNPHDEQITDRQGKELL